MSRWAMVAKRLPFRHWICQEKKAEDPLELVVLRVRDPAVQDRSRLHLRLTDIDVGGKVLPRLGREGIRVVADPTIWRLPLSEYTCGHPVYIYQLFKDLTWVKLHVVSRYTLLR